MVAISLSGSGEGPGWVTAPGYSTEGFLARPITVILLSSESGRGGAQQAIDVLADARRIAAPSP